ncbi:hypothetical protein DDM70_14590 [Vibrio cholerae]|uniref:hypothetical protein n=1 Tax=Vibrio TaxID=662 RepID=UPI0000F34CA4|nr:MULTISPECIES: hypothetical protein [Vibrio]EAZ75242.1 conserved hypothetical protein [Vibrio cholerae NCTC 8457]APF80469.1 hypothetical protein ASZ85_02978 [Vibrio cholerae]EGR2469216.1 hypothetical protein [Vibrio cholerae]EGR4373606.1 hypothetical protein [Vibrio cholerae]EJL6435723.1 hypothetical protein [Vibrio cholerae]
MGKVIPLHDKKREREVEDKFIDLLDREVKVEGNVQPLSTSLLDRMFAIKAAAEAAKARAEFLEG